MIYVFDTNIILHYLKEDAVMQKIKADFDPLNIQNETWLCVVTLGELRSISKANRWGEKRVSWLESFFQKFPVADLYHEEILEKYAEIEAFSQCRLPELGRPVSPRNMEKNDLWIAATTSVLKATLITTDRDFDHLDRIFFNLNRVEVPKSSL